MNCINYYLLLLLLTTTTTYHTAHVSNPVPVGVGEALQSIESAKLSHRN